MFNQIKIFAMAVVLLIFFVPRSVGAEEIIIFHTNDMHCRILNTDENGKAIGLSEMSAAVRTVKKQNKNTFWFDAGDTFQGMPRINISKGENMTPLLNQAGIEVFAPGNHDFYYGSDQLEILAKKLKIPVLSANIVRKGTGEKIFQPYKIFKNRNIKIGVFGLTTPETRYTSAPKHIETIDFLNPVEAANEMVKILRPQCDIVVAVMHMGLDQSSEFTSKRIAAETSGIDLIIDGHSHTELHEGLTVDETLIAQTGCYGHYFGKVTINLRDGKIISKKAELLDVAAVKKISPNPNKKILNSINKIEKRNEKIFGEVVAHSDKARSGARSLVRCRESEIGNLCADSIRWKTGADIAIMNGGGIRTDLPKGDITRGKILEIMPFSNPVKKVEIDGKAIRAMLEHSVFAYPEEFGSFLSVSGINFSFDPSQPVGQRVQDIFINGEILDENKIYTMAANDFLLTGGDDYTMLKKLKVLGQFGVEHAILTEYIKEFGIVGIELGRIKILDVVEEKQAA